jgi:hypothetical protein
MRIQSVHLNTLLSPWVPQKTKPGDFVRVIRAYGNGSTKKQTNKQSHSAHFTVHNYYPTSEGYICFRSKIKTKQNKYMFFSSKS